MMSFYNIKSCNRTGSLALVLEYAAGASTVTRSTLILSTSSAVAFRIDYTRMFGLKNKPSFYLPNRPTLSLPEKLGTLLIMTRIANILKKRTNSIEKHKSFGRKPQRRPEVGH